MSFDILLGDCAERLRGFPANYFDALLSDPPYGLRFMGKAWDYDVPSVDFWREALRVLKPGAPILAFSGTRTFHRMVVAIEDAGFEIRDALFWCYATGFPKSLDLSKAIDKHLGFEREILGPGTAHCPFIERGEVCPGHGDGGKSQSGETIHTPSTAPSSGEAILFDGWGTALKPALEPICLAMKPTEGTFAANAIVWQVAGLNIDGARIDRGNWPSNLLLDVEAARYLDMQSGNRQGGRPVPSVTESRPIWGHAGRLPFAGYNDEGGASRFFFVAKPTTWERNFGCEHLPLKSAGEVTEREDDTDGLNSPRAGAGRTSGNRNHHPTVKPITLAEYLATLLLPPETGRWRHLLVPFAGSGSEIIGALRAGWEDVVGIERDPESIAIAEARIKRWLQVPRGMAIADLDKPGVDNPRQGSLF